MASLTKDKLQGTLTKRLALKDPTFLLEKVGSQWMGDVISFTFRGKGDLQRQRMIWKALQTEFGEKSTAYVGMLLAYTPDEWNLGAEKPLPTQKAG